MRARARLLVNGDNRVWIVYAVALWQGCLAEFFLPAEQATSPLLVPEERRVQANAVNAQSRDLARLAGSTLGDVAVAWGGITRVARLGSTASAQPQRTRSTRPSSHTGSSDS
jgi:hypothetical protein